MARRRPPRTLMELAAGNLQEQGLGQLKSFTQAGAVCADLWAWAYCAHRLGFWPTQAEYADYWQITDRTVQRQWARFREAFPDEQSPERIARWIASELGARLERSAAAASVAAPPAAALA